MPFLAGVALAVLAMALLSYLLEVLVIRRLFGQPQFAVVILTIALGFVLRFVAGVIWGHDPQSLETPFAGKAFNLGGIALGYDEAIVIASTAVLTFVLYIFFARTKLGVAMQASSQNQLATYYIGIPVKWISSMIQDESTGLEAVYPGKSPDCGWRPDGVPLYCHHSALSNSGRSVMSLSR